MSLKRVAKKASRDVVKERDLRKVAINVAPDLIDFGIDVAFKAYDHRKRRPPEEEEAPVEERPPAERVYGAEAKSFEGQSDVDYCIECLVGPTILYTGNSVEKISSFNDRHTVIGHTGSIKSIDEVFKRPYDGDIVEIDFVYTNIPLKVTPEHPVLVVRDVRAPQSVWRDKGIDEGLLEWCSAGDLTDRDFVAFPRIQGIKDVGIATEELMELSGLYIAEGNPEYPERGMNVTFSLGRHEETLIDKTASLIETCFGVDPCITDTPSQTAVRVILMSKYYGPFFEQFGKGARNKTIPTWALYLPEEKQYRLVRGMIKGDGHPGEYSFTYSTTSMKLAYRFRLLLFRLGILHAVYKRKAKNSEIKGRKIKGGVYYTVSIGGDSARLLAEKIGISYDGGKKTSGNFGYVSENYVFIPIKKVRRIPFKGKVYNLHVNEAESYLTIHGALHNCSVKHSQTAKVLMREALQRAETGDPGLEGVQEKVRGVVEELCGLEDDTTTVSNEMVTMLNTSGRELRKFIYTTGAEVGKASIEQLREIKGMVDGLVEASYTVRAAEECPSCNIESVCGGDISCMQFLIDAADKSDTADQWNEFLKEARERYGD